MNVYVIYGFKCDVDVNDCVDGDKYMLCCGKLWKKEMCDDKHQGDFVDNQITLNVFVSDDGFYIGYKIGKYGTERSTSLPNYHKSMEHLTSNIHYYNKILSDINFDLDLSSEDFDFITVSNPRTLKRRV